MYQNYINILPVFYMCQISSILHKLDYQVNALPINVIYLVNLYTFCILYLVRNFSTFAQPSAFVEIHYV